MMTPKMIFDAYRGPMTWGDVAITYTIWLASFGAIWGLVQLGV